MILLLTAAIWGFSFVAQRVSTEHIGGFTFNGIRFFLGTISLIPLILFFDNKRGYNKINSKAIVLPGILTGIFAYGGATFQQIGIAYTTAGNAGFVTGLYIVIVPVIGIFLGHKTGKNLWFGIGLSIIGLFLLCVNENFSINYGDFFEIIGSFFWALQILAIGSFSKKFNPLKLSFIQFATCSFLSFIPAFLFEQITVNAISQSLIPILYGGFLSVGVAYTLQVIGQRNARPSHASIILSMESVFSAIGGAFILGESMSTKGYIGCMFILGGVIISQVEFSSILALNIRNKDYPRNT